MKTLTIIISLAIVMPNCTFLAKRGLLGKQESIKKIQDVTIKGSKGEDLYLAYKTSAQFVFLGLYFKDDGYVLGVKKKFGAYYPLSEKQITSFQEQGLLPKPLPTYDIPFFDYVMGYSLWIVLAFIIITQTLKYKFNKQGRSYRKV